MWRSVAGGARAAPTSSAAARSRAAKSLTRKNGSWNCATPRRWRVPSHEPAPAGGCSVARPRNGCARCRCCFARRMSSVAIMGRRPEPTEFPERLPRRRELDGSAAGRRSAQGSKRLADPAVWHCQRSAAVAMTSSSKPPRTVNPQDSAPPRYPPGGGQGDWESHRTRPPTAAGGDAAQPATYLRLDRAVSHPLGRHLGNEPGRSCRLEDDDRRLCTAPAARSTRARQGLRRACPPRSGATLRRLRRP